MIFFFLIIFYFSITEAHHKIYSPIVEEGRQFRVEGHFDVDDRNEVNKIIIMF